MNDLEDSGSPTLDNIDEPQGNADPGDMLNPDLEEEHSPNAPIADPTGDPDAEASDNPEDQPEPDDDPALQADDPDDDESELDELDEAQFDNFDPEAANIVVPVAIDETNVGQLGVHKRKRTEEEERERKKKKKEGRRVRESKKPKKRTEADELSGAELDGPRSRGSKPRAPRRPATPEDEETLSPEERRRRALDRKIEEALRTNKPVRRRAGDLQDMGEEELNIMRNRMATAAQLDQEARKRSEPASHKLKVLPAVVELLNRNTIRSAILDPDINVLEAVRFFLEPADEDAALPNYEIQREMFAILSKLRMTKEALIASGIGKVVMYYTKSNQPQPAIKRQAERLIQGWMSVVLNKKRSGRSQHIETREFDPVAASQRAVTNASQIDRAAVLEEKRRRALQAPVPGNRARIEGGLSTYTIAPRNTLSNVTQQPQRVSDDRFKHLAARAKIVKK